VKGFIDRPSSWVDRWQGHFVIQQASGAGPSKKTRKKLKRAAKKAARKKAINSSESEVTEAAPSYTAAPSRREQAYRYVVVLDRDVRKYIRYRYLPYL